MYHIKTNGALFQSMHCNYSSRHVSKSLSIALQHAAAVQIFKLAAGVSLSFWCASISITPRWLAGQTRRHSALVLFVPCQQLQFLRWQTVMAYPSDGKRNLGFAAYKNVSDCWLRSYDDILVLANKQERSSVPCPLSPVPADGVYDKTVLVEEQAEWINSQACIIVLIKVTDVFTGWHSGIVVALHPRKKVVGSIPSLRWVKRLSQFQCAFAWRALVSPSIKSTQVRWINTDGAAAAAAQTDPQSALDISM